MRGFSLLCLSALFIALAVVAPSASAQEPTLPTGVNIPPAALQQRDRIAGPTGLALEGPVDPAAYQVGPGDVFTVVIGGSVARQIQATVSADGYLAIPEVGSFRAADRSLATVKAQVRQALRRLYANVGTDIVLSQPREFFVHVSGTVPSPGRYRVGALSRVEDALAEAVGVERPVALLRPDLIGPQQPEAAAQPESRLLPALRNVRVTHRDGTEERVDLLRYYATGNLDHNPYLRDGDAVYLPPFAPEQTGIRVDGEVERAGIYDPRADDTVQALAEVAGASASAEAVRLVNAGEAPREVEPEASVPVPPRALLYVTSRDPLAGTAEAVGYVTYPGTYPIRSGVTTLRELVDMAGGFRPDALVRGSRLLRRPEALAPDDTMLTRPRARLSDLPFLSRAYASAAFQYAQQVALDVEAALAPGAPPVVLRDGDQFVVPPSAGAVLVFGQVSRSGYVPYQPGQAATAYITEAGGLAPGATTAYVVDAATGTYRLAEDSVVMPGDQVFVDRVAVADDPETQRLALQAAQSEREEAQAERDEERLSLQERSERRSATFQLVGTIISAVGAVATIIIAATNTSGQN